MPKPKNALRDVKDPPDVRGEIVYSDFTKIVTIGLDEIKYNFMVGSHNAGYPYDEDILIDAGFRCALMMRGKTLCKRDAMRYLWTSYLNTLKTKYNRLKRFTSFEDCTVHHEQPYADSDPYDTDVDRLCGLMLSSVREEFGDVEAAAWRDHVCYGKTYAELREIYGAMNYMHVFRKIKKFLLHKLPKRNKDYAELIEDYV